MHLIVKSNETKITSAKPLLFDRWSSPQISKQWSHVDVKTQDPSPGPGVSQVMHIGVFSVFPTDPIQLISYFTALPKSKRTHQSGETLRHVEQSGPRGRVGILRVKIQMVM